MAEPSHDLSFDEDGPLDTCDECGTELDSFSAYVFDSKDVMSTDGELAILFPMWLCRECAKNNPDATVISAEDSDDEL